jgi:hypothetical protein
MYRKILIGGMTAAAIVGAGGAALAFSGSDTPSSGTPTAGAASDLRANAGATAVDRQLLRGHRWLKRVAHGEIVTSGDDGFVTHDFIVGTATSVSATSITVRAADQKSETFVVNADTKVRVRGDGQRGLSSIDDVDQGDHVVVAGTGTSTFTAKHVIVLAN